MKGKEKAKDSTKKRFSFSFFKKHRVFTVSLIVTALAVGSFLVVNYGRYVKEIIQVYYLRTKNFYFTSDKLTITGKKYEINPWSGTVAYTMEIHMSSLLNSLKGTDSDITYNIKCEADNNTICYFGTRGSTEITDRVIEASSHSDLLALTIEKKDGVTLRDGQDVSVTVTANATSPYEEELKATFVLIVGNYGVDYKIEDVSGRLYMDSVVSNTLPTEPIRVKLEINDVDKYSFDMSNNVLSDEDTETVEDSNHNIKAVIFNVDAKSSMMVRYYKKDTAENNTYTGEGTPVITFTRLS